MSGVARGLLIVLVALGVAGCGSSTGGVTPEMATRLERVDAAAVADDPEALASAVAGLVRSVDEAETAGDLDAGDADDIRAAAEALLEAAAPDSPTSPGGPGDQATTPPAPADRDDEDDDERGRGQHREGKGKAKGHDKEKDTDGDTDGDDDD